MPDQLLTKSRFLATADCPKRLWLDANNKELARAKTDDELDRMRVGGIVEKLARGLYPNAVSAWQFGHANEAAAETTDKLMRDGAETILQATFIADGCLARADALRRASKDSWILDEIKSSTVKEPKKLRQDGKAHDLAFQMQVLGRAGVDVAGGHLVLLNNAYVWPGGDLDLGQLFGSIDMTEECAEIAEEVSDLTKQALRVLASSECPEIKTNTHCPGCPYYDHCHRDQPKHDVVFLPGIRFQDVEALRQLGYLTIDQIPEDHKLTDARRRVRDVIVSGKPHVGDGLEDGLDAIRFPAAFIDFESCQEAVPIFPGTRPYMQLCFQWSTHVLDSPRAEPAHLEHLHGDQTDPRPEFCRTLWEAVKDAATIVHYSSFEKTQLKAMAADDIPHASDLFTLLETHGADLEKIIKEHVYLEEFKGKSSIKYVLPALVPGMTYEGLAVNNGTAAAAAFRRLTGREPYDGDLPTLRRALLDYCKQDTLAMVKLYEAMRDLVEAK